MTRRFRLSAQALRDVAAILTHLHTGPNPSLVDRVEKQLFAAFADLAAVSGLGHLRRDLTEKDVLFYSTPPYVLILRQKRAEAYILRVVHGARQIDKLI